MRVDIRLYPLSTAEANPVGSARNDANMEPYLPPPVGRMEFSLNPFKMLVSQNFQIPNLNTIVTTHGTCTLAEDKRSLMHANMLRTLHLHGTHVN